MFYLAISSALFVHAFMASETISEKLFFSKEFNAASVVPLGHAFSTHVSSDQTPAVDVSCRLS